MKLGKITARKRDIALKRARRATKYKDYVIDYARKEGVLRGNSGKFIWILYGHKRKRG